MTNIINRKIQVFQYGRKRLASMGLIPIKRLNGRLLANLALLFSNVFTSAMFLLYNANSFWEYTNSILASLATSVGLILFILLVIQAWRLHEIIDFCQKIFDERTECSPTRMVYFKANIHVEKWCKIVDFILSRCIPIACMLPKFTFSIYMYVMTDLRNDAFDLTYPVWVPYDWKNPIGYMVTVTYQYILLQRLLSSIGLYATLGIGGLLSGKAFVYDVKEVLKSTNDSAIVEKQNKFKAIKKLSEFIELHANVKDEAIFISDTLEPIAAVIFVSSLVTLCCSMLLIQMQLLNEGLVMVFLEFGYAIYSFGLLFVACEIAQRACDAFNSFDLDIGQIDWYLYPIVMKKMLPVILNMAQKPVEFKWFGSLAADRDTFKKICNKAYSFFMVLREFSQ